MKAIHFTTETPATCPANEIWFYDRLSPYYEFTNFYRRPVRINGKTWPTTEHYFQAQKFIGTPFEEHICKLSSAREAFQFSREPKVQRWIRSDWNTVKDDILKLALLEKFGQHADLQKKLIDTGDKRLVEHTSNDSYWGDGGDGTGRNRLGELLMEVRRRMKLKHDTGRSNTSSSTGLRRCNSWSTLTIGTSTSASSNKSVMKATSPSSRKRKSSLIPLPTLHRGHSPSAGSRPPWRS